jgi:hypothetical protein
MHCHPADMIATFDGRTEIPMYDAGTHRAEATGIMKMLDRNRNNQIRQQILHNAHVKNVKKIKLVC